MREVGEKFKGRLLFFFCGFFFALQPLLGTRFVRTSIFRCVCNRRNNRGERIFIYFLVPSNSSLGISDSISSNETSALGILSSNLLGLSRCCIVKRGLKRGSGISRPPPQPNHQLSCQVFIPTPFLNPPAVGPHETGSSEFVDFVPI